MAKMLKVVGAILEGIASASVEIQTGVEKPVTVTGRTVRLRRFLRTDRQATTKRQSASARMPAWMTSGKTEHWKRCSRGPNRVSPLLYFQLL